MSRRSTDAGRPSGSRPERRDKLIREREHDPYKSDAKLPEPTACSGCGAVYKGGRWTWETADPDAHTVVCPACRRERDAYPGGHVTLRGEFVRRHEEEILALVRNIEEREKAQRPLKRIMRIEDTDDDADSMRIATTDASLARDIGDALHSAYQGELSYDYVEEGSVLRVEWER
jgi:NMD protein affecting ribosome stability and mRNA decay